MSTRKFRSGLVRFNFAESKCWDGLHFAYPLLSLTFHPVIDASERSLLGEYDATVRDIHGKFVPCFRCSWLVVCHGRDPAQWILVADSYSRFLWAEGVGRNMEERNYGDL